MKATLHHYLDPVGHVTNLLRDLYRITFKLHVSYLSAISISLYCYLCFATLDASPVTSLDAGVVAGTDFESCEGGQMVPNYTPVLTYLLLSTYQYATFKHTFLSFPTGTLCPDLRRDGTSTGRPQPGLPMQSVRQNGVRAWPTHPGQGPL